MQIHVSNLNDPTVRVDVGLSNSVSDCWPAIVQSSEKMPAMIITVFASEIKEKKGKFKEYTVIDLKLIRL